MVTFEVSFDAAALAALTPTEQIYVEAHLIEAGHRWTRILALDGDRSIEIEVTVSNAIPYSDGASLTSVQVGTAGGRDLFEQGVGSELKTGVDPNGASPDARITLNPAYVHDELWFDPNPAMRLFPVPLDKTDAFSTMLHELGHAIAYAGWNDATTGAPQPTYWSTFDRWMVPGAVVTFAGPAVVALEGAAPALTTGNNRHWANTGSDPAWFFELMNGVLFYRGTRYDISALDRAVLTDVGFTVEAVFADSFE